jgi:hypothetical protein
MSAPWRPWGSLDKHEKPLVVSALCVIFLLCLWALFWRDATP